MRPSRLAPVVLAVAALFACSPPKYVPYTSINGDWKSVVPWHWNVMTDQEKGSFASTNFIGPFDPEFYLGAPSFGVRWHAYKRVHRLPDGLVEHYESVDDYVDQMLKAVYGPDRHIVDGDEPSREVPIGELEVDKRKAKHFVVLSPVPVPNGTQWGTSVDPDTGRLVNVRLHEYVVIPLEKGFYVLVYPATLKGYKYYRPQFNALVHGFKIVKDGPEAPAAAASSAASGKPAKAP